MTTIVLTFVYSKSLQEHLKHFSKFSRNSEELASEFRYIFEEMFLRYYYHVCSRFKQETTRYYVTRMVSVFGHEGVFRNDVGSIPGHEYKPKK